MQRKNSSDKKKLRLKFGLIIATTFVMFAGFIMTKEYKNLLKKSDEFDQKIKTLEGKVEYESERANDLKEQKDYTKSKEYLEELARDRIGLIADDEILIIPK